MSSEADDQCHAPSGKLVVISGPSGAGKTSICNALLERLPNTTWSVSVTTRPKRGGEVDAQARVLGGLGVEARERERGEERSCQDIGRL